MKKKGHKKTTAVQLHPSIPNDDLLWLVGRMFGEDGDGLAAGSATGSFCAKAGQIRASHKAARKNLFIPLNFSVIMILLT